LPASNQAVRAALHQELEQRGHLALHAELASVDPAAAARIHANDSQRLLRALEVWRQTGTPLSSLQGAWRGEPRRDGLLIGVAPPDRALLHARIEQRLDSMIAAGFLREVRTLMALPGLHADLPSMRAVGYRQALGHLQGEYDLPRFRELALYATRQLAKRQLTWLRAEPSLQRFDPAAPGALKSILARIRSALDESR
jgi:tRNA dimethylallyltransferase